METLNISEYSVEIDWIQDVNINNFYNLKITNDKHRKQKFTPIYLRLKIYPKEVLTIVNQISKSNKGFILDDKLNTSTTRKINVNKPYKFIIRNINSEYIIKTYTNINSTIEIKYDMDYELIISDLFKKLEETFDNYDDIIEIILLELQNKCLNF
jgi:hypothetical protein